MVADSEIQRIARLTPLADVLASFDLSVGPVEPREEAVSKALGLTLAASVVIPNHVLSRARQPIHLADGGYDDLKSIAASTTVSGPAGADLHLVLAVMGLWGEDARSRLRFVDVPTPERPSKLSALFGR